MSKIDFVFIFLCIFFVRSYKRVSRLFVFSVMLSVIAVLGVLFFCLNVLFDVSLFRFAVLRAAARRYLIFRLRILHFFDKFRDFSNILPCFVHYCALPNAHHCVKD